MSPWLSKNVQSCHALFKCLLRWLRGPWRLPRVGLETSQSCSNSSYVTGQESTVEQSYLPVSRIAQSSGVPMNHRPLWKRHQGCGTLRQYPRHSCWSDPEVSLFLTWHGSGSGASSCSRRSCLGPRVSRSGDCQQVDDYLQASLPYGLLLSHLRPLPDSSTIGAARHAQLRWRAACHAALTAPATWTCVCCDGIQISSTRYRSKWFSHHCDGNPQVFYSHSPAQMLKLCSLCCCALTCRAGLHSRSPGRSASVRTTGESCPQHLRSHGSTVPPGTACVVTTFRFIKLNFCL